MGIQNARYSEGEAMTKMNPPNPALNIAKPDRGGHPDGHAEKVDGDGYLKSLVVKRSLLVGNHKTSVSLEDVFWNALRAIANERGVGLSKLLYKIDSERQHTNLSSAIRLFVYEHHRKHSENANLRNKP
jgi:predicted DNA-binding ribbon-helix-helix protein